MSENLLDRSWDVRDLLQDRLASDDNHSNVEGLLDFPSGNSDYEPKDDYESMTVDTPLEFVNPSFICPCPAL